MRRKQPVDEIGDFRLGVHRPAKEDRQEVREARRQEQDERKGGQEKIERDSAREEQRIVLTAVVPDPFGVVAQRPPEPCVERTLVDT